MNHCAGCTYTQTLDDLRAEFPAFKMVWKEDSLFMKLVNAVLFFCTFGACRDFMTKYTTTVGCRVYVPRRWSVMTDYQRVIILRHERVHMRQRRTFTLPIYALLYVCVPLPLGFCYFRALFEMEAYEETIRATVELYPNGAEAVQSKQARAQMVANFTGAGYGWMWPFPGRIESWYDHTVKTVLAEYYAS